MIKSWEPERQAELSARKKREQAIEKQRQQAAARAQEKVNTGQCDPIQAYNDSCPIEIALTIYGYQQKGKKYISPNSESGTPGVIIKDGKIFSHHSSDSGIGKPCSGGGVLFDSFDLFCHYEHGGNEKQAVKAAGDRFTIQDPVKGDIVTLTKYNQREYMRQQSHEQTGSPGGETKKPKPKIEIVSLYEIRDRNPQVNFLVSGFMIQGDGVIIHAPGGLGKSMLTLNLALQFATRNPKPLFDQFDIQKPIASLFYQTENSAATINSRIRSMVSEDPKKIDALKLIAMPKIHNDVVVSGRQFTDQEYRRKMIDTIDAAADHLGRKIDILWIDPLISFCGGDENDSAKMRLELDALNEICRDAGVTPVVVHHDNRQGGYRGSSAIPDWCRSMIGLSREFIGSDRITDFHADGQPVKRVQPIPCIRMIHEMSNNMPKFNPMLLRMDSHLNFHVVEESLTPEQAEQGKMVVQALTDLGGTANSRNELAKTYGELSGLSQTAAANHIKTAVNNSFIFMESILVSGKQAYKYTLPKVRCEQR